MGHNDNVDMTEQNIIGAIDRFVTNAALAGLAIVPSLLIVVCMPRRLLPMITGDHSTGRNGMLLAPGVFFPLLALASILIVASIIPDAPAPVDVAASSSPAAGQGGQVGLSVGQAARIAEVWRTGNFNQVLLLVLPMFCYSVLTSVATSWLRVLVGSWWTIRVAVRTGFYLFGATLGISSIVVIAMLSTDRYVELRLLISNLMSLVIAVWMVWWFFWIFKTGGVDGLWRVIGMALLVLLSILIAVLAITVLV